jgi:N utilization substance protein B
MSNRRTVRENVIQALYAWQVSGQTVEEVFNRLLKPLVKPEAEEIRNFAESLFLKTARKFDSYDEIIGEQVKNWDVERLAILDKVILKTAFTEFLDFEDIPVKVTINEAIDIAKVYSTDHSGKFVNGIMDAVLARWKTEGKIAKSGRGLLDETLKK